MAFDAPQRKTWKLRATAMERQFAITLTNTSIASAAKICNNIANSLETAISLEITDCDLWFRNNHKTMRHQSHDETVQQQDGNLEKPCEI